jgi:transcriptional regulator with GAF, ATPase, and Fis domain
MTNDVGHQQVRSLLCAPLSAFDHVLGVLYLTTATRDFDVEDLQFISAAAGIAAVALHNASHVRALEDERDRLRTDAGRERKLLGESPSMRAVDERIDKLARADSTVLIHGETGTGKELAARAIHQRSPRARHPFIDVNCAAIPRDLVENELFGHEKGGFSNATTQKKGLVELADGGTLFLDEIGDLPLELQPKLLRVLQEREFRRVGGTATIRVDIRVIVATNRDLKQAIDAGTFREDLFHRLTIDLWMPPLRDRQDDILLLALFFVQKHSRRCGRRIDGIAADALAALQAYEWRGNVRELENVIEQAAVIGSSTEVRLKDLPPRVQKATAAPQTRGELHKATQGAKEDAVRRALERTNYDYAEAAAWLGIHVNALHRLIKALGIPKKPRR